MQQSEVSCPHVVEVDLDFGPVVQRGVVERLALGLVVDEAGVVDVSGAVDAAAELPGEQVDTHDAEDQPEDETDQQHVHDGGNRPDQSVHHHLDRQKQTGHTLNSLREQIQGRHQVFSLSLVRFKD